MGVEKEDKDPNARHWIASRKPEPTIESTQEYAKEKPVIESRLGSLYKPTAAEETERKLHPELHEEGGLDAVKKRIANLKKGHGKLIIPPGYITDREMESNRVLGERYQESSNEIKRLEGIIRDSELNDENEANSLRVAEVERIKESADLSARNKRDSAMLDERKQKAEKEHWAEYQRRLYEAQIKLQTAWFWQRAGLQKTIDFYEAEFKNRK